MADKLHEQISALIDDECPSAEVELAVRQLSARPELAACWRRYHLINDALNGQLPDAVDGRFLARVQQAVAAEPEPLAAPAEPPLAAATRRYRPLFGIATAASLTAAVGAGLLLLQPWDTPNGLAEVPIDSLVKADSESLAALPLDPSAGMAQKQLADAQPAQPVEFASASASDESEADVSQQARLRDYLTSHNGYASLNSVHGVLPYVRQVSLSNDTAR